MTSSSAPTVFVVEDHPIVRRGIVGLVGEHYEVVGSAESASAAIEMIIDRWPDLVLLDVHFPGGGGEAVAREVRKTIPDLKILCLTVSSSRKDVARMFNAGVDGYVTKTDEEHEIIEAIEATLAGRRPISRSIAGFALDIDADAPTGTGFEKLTRKERAVVELIARGFTYKETAAEVGIAVKTLENHMSSIFRKLNAQSRYEITRRAYEDGFLNPDDGIDPSNESDSEDDDDRDDD